MKKIGLFLIIGVFLITLTGCGTLFRKAAEERSKKEIEKKTGVKVETGKGVKVKDIPKELIYPGSKATGRSSFSSATGKSIAVTFSTSAGLDKIKAYYDSKPGKEGWQETFKQEGTDEVNYILSKGEQVNATINAKSQAGKTTISLTYYKATK